MHNDEWQAIPQKANGPSPGGYLVCILLSFQDICARGCDCQHATSNSSDIVLGIPDSASMKYLHTLSLLVHGPHTLFNVSFLAKRQVCTDLPLNSHTGSASRQH